MGEGFLPQELMAKNSGLIWTGKVQLESSSCRRRPASWFQTLCQRQVYDLESDFRRMDDIRQKGFFPFGEEFSSIEKFRFMLASALRRNEKSKLPLWAWHGFRVFIFCLPLLVLSIKSVYGSSPAELLDRFSKRVSSFTLNNGMRVLVVERDVSPVISFAVYIRTGGMDDEGGKSGLAHMFEHMLFKGTKTIGVKDYKKEAQILDEIDRVHMSLQTSTDPVVLQTLFSELEQLNKRHQELLVPEEYWQIYETAGAQGLNASTGFDFTNYVVSLPANQLELWMALESDRIKNPVLREFYKERSVVLEERRMRVDTSASGKLWETFLATAYLAHPYGRPILGWQSEISQVTRQDAEVFFRRHYDVSRLVVAIVGDVKVPLVREKMQKYFGDIRSNGVYEAPRIPIEPQQEGQRRVEVLFDAEPSLLMGYHRPDMNSPDEPVLVVVADLLSSGATSRLEENVVQKKRLATSIWAGESAPGERAPSLFVIGATPRHPHSITEVEKAIEEQIDILKEKGPTAQELERVKNNALADLLRPMDDNMTLANQLGYYEAVGGDWRKLPAVVKGIQNVTAEDVKLVMRKIFISSNKTVGFISKKK